MCKKSYKPLRILRNYRVYIVIFWVLCGLIFIIFQLSYTNEYFIKEAAKLYFQGELQLALKEYNKVLQENPTNIDALINSAIIYNTLGEYEKGISYLKTIIQSKLYDKWTIYLLANTYYNAGQLNNAKELYEYIINIYPEFKDIYFDLARVYLEKGELKKAYELFIKVINEKPYCAACYAYIGKIYQLQDSIDNAINAYEEALKKDSNYCEVYYSLAYLYEKKDNYKKAYDYYNKICNLDSSDYNACQRSKQLLAYLPKPKIPVAKPKLPTSISWKRPLHYPYNTSSIPIVRVGLGVNRKGELLKRNQVYFQCSDEFEIIMKYSNWTLFVGEKKTIYGVKASGKNKLIIVTSQDEELITSNEPIIIKLNNPNGNTIAIYNMAYGVGFPWERYEIREYRGEIEISPDEEKGLIVVNIVNIEEYLYGVVPSEMPYTWPKEALKAQATAARTFTISRLKNKPHKKYNFDLCDDQHCQVYRGVKVEKEQVIEAVDETRGRIITFNNKPILAFYCSNTGGVSQSSGSLSGWQSLSYIQEVIDGKEITLPSSPLDIEIWLRTSPITYSYSPASTYRWIRIIKREDLERRLNSNYKIGKLLNIIPLKRSRSGNINKLKIVGTRNEVIIEKEHMIRRLLGLGNIRSTAFVIDKKLKNNEIEYFTLYGAGWGHGIGMSQYGARGMAARGFNYENILKHYYKGVEIENIGY